MEILDTCKRYNSQQIENTIEEISYDLDDEKVIAQLKNAIKTNETLTGYCQKSLKDGTLVIKLGNNIKGYIPLEDLTWQREKDGTVHKGVANSKVGLNVHFKVKRIEKNDNEDTLVYLSRKEAMLEVAAKYQKDLTVGMILSGIVIGMQPFGAFIDIGGDVTGVVSLADINRVHLQSPNDALKIGQRVNVILSSIKTGVDGNTKLFFSRKELLPSFDDIDKYYEVGETVIGKVKTQINTGLFVELDESFEGLADFPNDRKVKYGDIVKVKIEGISKEKRKIKLRII